MDELESIGLGLALGLVILAALSRYPGEPFDYTTHSSSSSSVSDGDGQTNESISSRSDHSHKHVSSTASRVPTSSPAATGFGARTSCCASSSSLSSSSRPPPTHSCEQTQDDAKAAHRRKIQKLQTLLGIESNKMAQLAARADAVGTATSDRAHAAASPFGATATYSARLDMAFYAIVLALLVAVLQTEYGVNVLHLAAHLFPREVETATRVASVPRQLVQWLFRSRTAA